MKPGKVTHYLLSLLTGTGSFFLAYGLLQYFVTRNISSDLVILEVAKLVLNFAVAGFVGGAAYAGTFKHGYLPLAVVPAISIGGPLLALSIVHGGIGGIESITIKTWQFAIPVVVGICCGYIGASIVRRIVVPTRS